MEKVIRQAICPVCGRRVMDLESEYFVHLLPAEKESIAGVEPQGYIKCMKCKKILAFAICKAKVS